MTGNVAEWAADWYYSYAYKYLETEDPYKFGRNEGPCNTKKDGLHRKARRGGSWDENFLDSIDQLASERGVGFPDKEFSNIGFRCVKGQPYKIVEEKCIPEPVQPPSSCLFSITGQATGKSISDNAILSLIKLLISD
jgi:hypothetical protein